MNICVCIKQVPDTQKVRIDPEKGTLIRKEVPSIINPYDESALEMAFEIAERTEANITVLSMGIPSVERVLRYAIALGADRAFLLSSPAFAGSDTLATSYILSQGIKKTGPYDLIIMGKQAIDGDTGQVGPEVSVFLNYPVVTYVDDFFDLEGGSILLHRYVENIEEVIKLKLPGVITVVKAKKRLRLPLLNSLIKSFNTRIHILGPEDIDADVERCGLKGSPTRVRKTFTPEVKRGVTFIEGSIKERAKTLKKILSAYTTG